jgi:hypothetical protein
MGQRMHRVRGPRALAGWSVSLALAAALLLPSKAFPFGIMGGGCNTVTPTTCTAIESLITNGLLQDVHQMITNDALLGAGTSGEALVAYSPPPARTDLVQLPTLVGPGVAAKMEVDNASVDKTRVYEPVWHCDYGLIAQCTQMISDALVSVQGVLQTTGYVPAKTIYARAQQPFAETLHTLQDFFAHSNWVETLGNSSLCPPLTPAPAVFVSSVPITPSPAGCMPAPPFSPILWGAPSTQFNGFSLLVNNSSACRQNPGTESLNLNAPPQTSQYATDHGLTSGWYLAGTNRRQLLLYLASGLTLYNPDAPDSTCAHGLINFSQLPLGPVIVGATEGAVLALDPLLEPLVLAIYGGYPETGINKDNSGRANYPAAYADARYATQQFTLAAINTPGANPDSVCEFLTNLVCLRPVDVSSDPMTLPAGGGVVEISVVVDRDTTQPGGIDPTGMVTFSDSSGSPLTCAEAPATAPANNIVPVINGATTATATCTTNLLQAPDTVFAVYSGDSVYPENFGSAPIALSGSSSGGACTNGWNISGTWSVQQSNSDLTTWTLVQQGDQVTGSASALSQTIGLVILTGTVTGTVSGSNVVLSIFWTGTGAGGSIGTFSSEYSWSINPSGQLINGITGPSNFTSGMVFTCM